MQVFWTQEAVITIGRFGNAERCLRLLREDGCEVDACTEQIVRSMSFSSTERSLVVRSCAIGAFGHADLVDYPTIVSSILLDAGSRYGRLPAEAGPAMRLAFKDQPMGDLVAVVSPAIWSPHGFSTVLCLSCWADTMRKDGVRHLCTRYAGPCAVWPPEMRVAFAFHGERP